MKKSFDMIVKCTKTGKILASDDEIREHSEAFGVCAFEEIEPDSTKLFMNMETGKYCFTRNELDVFLRRSGESTDSFSEITVTEFLKVRSLKQQQRCNDIKVQKFANEKFFNALVDIKGYGVVPAEKALWFTKNASLDSAEEWLKSHVNDPDFNQPLKLVSDQLETPVSEQQVSEEAVVPKLSKEEAQVAGLELQRKLRGERLARDANEAKEKERLRVLQTKKSLEHQAQIEESNRIREIANRGREKKMAEQHKAELAEKIRLDYIERFGKEPPVEKPVEKAPKDQILSHLNAIRKKYDQSLVLPCLSSLKLYLSNIASNSTEKKYHKIKCTNKTFLKISPISEAIEILNLCGFQNNDSDELEIKTDIADGFLCAQTVKYIDVIISAIS